MWFISFITLSAVLTRQLFTQTTLYRSIRALLLLRLSIMSISKCMLDRCNPNPNPWTESRVPINIPTGKRNRSRDLSHSDYVTHYLHHYLVLKMHLSHHRYLYHLVLTVHSTMDLLMGMVRPVHQVAEKTLLPDNMITKFLLILLPSHTW